MRGRNEGRKFTRAIGRNIYRERNRSLCTVPVGYNEVNLDGPKDSDYSRDERWRERSIIYLHERAFPPLHWHVESKRKLQCMLGLECDG